MKATQVIEQLKALADESTIVKTLLWNTYTLYGPEGPHNISGSGVTTDEALFAFPLSPTNEAEAELLKHCLTSQATSGDMLKRPLYLLDGLTDTQRLHLLAALAVYEPKFDAEGAVLYYASLKDKSTGRLTKTTYGRFASRMLTLTGDSRVESVSQQVATHFEKFKVKFIENNDKAGWRAVYNSPRVGSCMRGKQQVICYASSAFEGLPDNGLRLAYLGDNKALATARCIVHEPTKTYVRVYGDNNLRYALNHLGYTAASSYPEGLILAAPKGRTSGKLKAPYLDGRLIRADPNEEPNKHPYWVLSSEGQNRLQTTNPWHTPTYRCPSCGYTSGGRKHTAHLLEFNSETGEFVPTDKIVCHSCEDGRVQITHESMAYYVLKEHTLIHDHAWHLATPEIMDEYQGKFSKALGHWVSRADSTWVEALQDWYPNERLLDVTTLTGTEKWPTSKSFFLCLTTDGVEIFMKRSESVPANSFGYEARDSKLAPCTEWTRAHPELAHQFWHKETDSAYVGGLIVQDILKEEKSA